MTNEETAAAMANANWEVETRKLRMCGQKIRFATRTAAQLRCAEVLTNLGDVLHPYVCNYCGW